MFKKHSLKSLYSKQIAQEARDLFETAFTLVVSVLGEIKLYLQINLETSAQIIILQLSSTCDEQGKVRRLGKRRKHGKNSKYSKE
jgi:hypothetical protein